MQCRLCRVFLPFEKIFTKMDIKNKFGKKYKVHQTVLCNSLFFSVKTKKQWNDTTGCAIIRLYSISRYEILIEKG